MGGIPRLDCDYCLSDHECSAYHYAVDIEIVPTTTTVERNQQANLTVHVTNTGDLNGTFILEVSNLDNADFVALSNTSVYLTVGSSASVNLHVSDQNVGRYRVLSLIHI